MLDNITSFPLIFQWEFWNFIKISRTFEIEKKINRKLGKWNTIFPQCNVSYKSWKEEAINAEKFLFVYLPNISSYRVQIVDFFPVIRSIFAKTLVWCEHVRNWYSEQPNYCLHRRHYASQDIFSDNYTRRNWRKSFLWFLETLCS